MAKEAQSPREDRLKALESARLQIERQFGKGALMQLGENADIEIDVIPSGSVLLDAALGVGGYPRGRIIEVYGPESSGKTTLALQAIAESQKQGGIAAFIDAEHALDPIYASNLGVNIDELWVSQPDTGEQALEIVEAVVRSAAVDIVVVDSVAALTPRAEIEGEMGDAHMGLQARLMSQALRKLTATVSKSNTCLVFINQIRMKIGVMFGNPETTTGGRALKFYASVRLEVRRIETIEKGSDEAVGNRVRIKVVKNKVAPPFRQVEVEMMFGEGISMTGSLLDAAVQNNIIEKSGSWYSYGKERIGQGRDAAKKFLQEHKDAAQQIETEVRKILLPERKRKPRPEATAIADAASAEAAAVTPDPAPPPPRRSAAAKAATSAAGNETKEPKELF